MKDIDIRNGLKNTLLKKYVDDSESFLIDEFNVSLGVVRADIALFNGVMHAYEIKSECDTLKRLDNQIYEYNKFFEYVTVVSCEKFMNRVLESVPENCGLILAKNGKDGVKFKQVRKAKKNKGIDKICLAKALWKDEMIEILENKQYNRGFKSKSKPLLYEILAQEFSANQLVQIVKNKIKKRAKLAVESEHIQCDGYSRLFSM